jgi:surfeit locus 1 family protein
MTVAPTTSDPALPGVAQKGASSLQERGTAQAKSVAHHAGMRRRGVLVPSLATVAALLVLVGLGEWQLQRLAWKEGLIATLAERLSAAPVALPPPAVWPRLSAEHNEFLRVAVTAVFENDKEALVYTGGSSLREATGGPGYWVFTPARLADGNHLMVNRGFVPEGRQKVDTRLEGQVADPINLVGALRWPEVPGLFTPAGDPAHNLWFARNSTAIAAAKGVSVAPFYLELESPQPPDGLPRAGRLQPNLPNSHLQYAVTWFGLAVVFAGAYLAWLFGSWRKREATADGTG